MRKSKKILSLVLVLAMCLSMSAMAAQSDGAEDTVSLINLNSDNVTVSEAMTYEEAVEYYALTHNITTQEATEFVPLISLRSATYSYRLLTVSLTVDSTYKPKLYFYCVTDESGSFWGIVEIYNMELYREYNGISKQFSGTVKFWLRSAYEIEYIINGDFYNNGETTTTVGMGANVGLDVLASLSFSASITSTTNHYKYFYEAETVAFQS